MQHRSLYCWVSYQGLQRTPACCFLRLRKLCGKEELLDTNIVEMITKKPSMLFSLAAHVLTHLLPRTGPAEEQLAMVTRTKAKLQVQFSNTRVFWPMLENFSLGKTCLRFELTGQLETVSPSFPLRMFSGFQLGMNRPHLSARKAVKDSFLGCYQWLTTCLC